MAFRDYWEDVADSIPRLPPAHAQTLVNRAWHRLCDFRLWSWKVVYGYITTPAAITTGTCTVTLGSNKVVFDTAASAALNAVAGANPPLAYAQVGVGRQFRIGSQVSGTPGALYTLIAWDGASTATLERVFAEATAAGQPYMVYKCYYQPPPSDGTSPQTEVDFLRYFSIANPASGYAIRKRKLFYLQDQLNSIDPQRGASGDAYILANYTMDQTNPNIVSGNTIHEWYPHPVNLRVYKCLYQKRGLDLSDTYDIPSEFPQDLLIDYAYLLGAKWALRQVSVYAELANTNWVAVINDMKSALFDPREGRLIRAIMADDEISPLTAFTQSGTFDFPLGGQFLQNHDVSRLVGGLD